MGSKKTFFLIIVCIIILAIIAFFIYQHRKKWTEMFIDNVDDAYEDTLNAVFQTHLLRKPTKKEIKRYASTMRNPNDFGKVIRSIQRTDEYQKLQKNMDKSYSHNDGDEILAPNIPLQVDEYDITDKRVDDMEPDERAEYYRYVIGAYDATLYRMPTLRELNYYTSRMISDKSFNQNQLIKVLQSSREFQLLKRNQSNQVYSELPLNITNAQLEYEVEEVYREAMGLPSSDGDIYADYNDKDDEDDEDDDYKKDRKKVESRKERQAKQQEDEKEKMMTPEMMSFLKQKYVEYELDKQRLKQLVLLIEELDKQNINYQKIIYYKDKEKEEHQDKSIPKPFDLTQIYEPKDTKLFGRITGKTSLPDGVQTNNDDGELTETFTDGSDKETEENNENNETEDDEGYYTEDQDSIIQDRYKETKDRYPTQEERKMENAKKRKEREKRFDKYNKRQNRKIRRKYAKQNDDVELKDNDKNTSEKEKDNNYYTAPGLGEMIGDITDTADDYFSMHQNQDKKAKSKNKRIKNNDVLLQSNINKGNKNTRYSEYKNYKEKQEKQEKDKKANVVPYNICNKDPFHEIYKKSREVYNKKRNGVAYLQNQRNKDELENVCKRQSKYLNADNNMVLFPEYKWSVPQPRPPVCIPETNTEYKPMIAQTALIGTLLEDF